MRKICALFGGALLLVGGTCFTRLKQFEATMGAEFKPAPLLEGVVAEKKRLQDL